MLGFKIYLLLALLYGCSELGHGANIEVSTTKTVIIDVPPKHTPDTPVLPEVVPELPILEKVSPKVQTAPAPSSAPVPSSDATLESSSSLPSSSITAYSPLPSTILSSTPPSTPKQTPKPAPKPVSPPEQGKWNVTNDAGNVSCIIVQFAAQFNISYMMKVNDSSALSFGFVNVPTNATAQGSCGESSQELVLTWGNETVTKNIMTLTYAKNDTTKEYNLANISVVLLADNFFNATSNSSVSLVHGSEWAVPLTMSYRCEEATKLNFTSDAPNVSGQLTLTKLQEEAFRSKSDTGFSTARDCRSNDVPDVVPVAVGCALGGLVVVVLIAYLVGRRRASGGYLSM